MCIFPRKQTHPYVTRKIQTKNGVLEMGVQNVCLHVHHMVHIVVGVITVVVIIQAMFNVTQMATVQKIHVYKDDCISMIFI
jgi:hypothetical protein